MITPTSAQIRPRSTGTLPALACCALTALHLCSAALHLTRLLIVIALTRYIGESRETLMRSEKTVARLATLERFE